MAPPASAEGTRVGAVAGWNEWIFCAVSNELSSPKVLACSSDAGRNKATTFVNPANIAAGNLSYFIGIQADEGKPQTILTGDRNVTKGGTVGAARAKQNWDSATALADYDGTIHVRAGNIGLADGSASQVSGTALKKQIENAWNSYYSPNSSFDFQFP